MRDIKKIIYLLSPPDNWKVPVIFLLAIFVGLFSYIFYISRAYSYLSDKPETCVNCHIMIPQYTTWQHSSHSRVANCNDCHVPHNNVIRKYLFKAADGMRHATIFTLRMEPQVITIKEAGKNVVQENCIRCHQELIYKVNLGKKDICNVSNHCSNDGRLCWDCHREIPHGRVNSISSVKNSNIPLPTSPLPEWLDKVNKK